MRLNGLLESKSPWFDRWEETWTIWLQSLFFNRSLRLGRFQTQRKNEIRWDQHSSCTIVIHYLGLSIWRCSSIVPKTAETSTDLTSPILRCREVMPVVYSGTAIKGCIDALMFVAILPCRYQEMELAESMAEKLHGFRVYHPDDRTRRASTGSG